MNDIRQRLMDEMTPASLRIGVVGDNQQAILFALALREHGRHRVVGMRLDPSTLTDAEAIAAWDGHAPIPNATTRKLAELCQLVYLFPGDPSTSGVASVLVTEVYLSRPSHWMPLVIGSWDLRLYQEMAQRDLYSHCPIVYNPVPVATSLDGMVSPGAVWVASEDRSATDLVTRVWTPIVNTVPVIRTGLRRVSPTGLLLPPSVLDAPEGMPITLPPELTTERSSDAPDR